MRYLIVFIDEFRVLAEKIEKLSVLLLGNETTDFDFDGHTKRILVLFINFSRKNDYLQTHVPTCLAFSASKWLSSRLIDIRPLSTITANNVANSSKDRVIFLL